MKVTHNMKNILLTLTAALSLTISARADLGDTKWAMSKKYTLDRMTIDGPSEFGYYHDNAGHEIDFRYDKQGIAYVAFYSSRLLGNLLPDEDVDYFLHINHLPTLESNYWTERTYSISGLPGDRTWDSKDYRYSVSFNSYCLVIDKN
jgi:hypothetical protein